MTEQVRIELKEVRDANKNLDTTKFTQEKYITEYSLRLSSLQREIDDKSALLAQSASL
jgi:hypothetical protein